MKKTLLKHIVSAITARENCEASNNQNWLDKWDLVINRCQSLLPSGAGFDSGTGIVKLADYGNHLRHLILKTSFHHMDEMGGYDGWTEHYIAVKPDLLFDYTLEISGEDRNDIKEFIADSFQSALDAKYILDGQLNLIPVTE